MVDEPENMMLRLLREMREDMAAMKQDMATIKARQDGQDRTLEAIVRVLGEHTMELAAIRADVAAVKARQDRMETRLEAVASAVVQGFRATAAALEAHGARLARIERHLGLTTA